MSEMTNKRIYFPLGLLQMINDRINNQAQTRPVMPLASVASLDDTEQKKKRSIEKRLRELRIDLSQSLPSDKVALRREIDSVVKELEDFRHSQSQQLVFVASTVFPLRFTCAVRATLARPFGQVVEAISFDSNLPQITIAEVAEGITKWREGEFPFKVQVSGFDEVLVLPFDENLDLLFRAGRVFEILAKNFKIPTTALGSVSIGKQIDAVKRNWSSKSTTQKQSLLRNRALKSLGFIEIIDDVPGLETLRREISALPYLAKMVRSKVLKAMGYSSGRQIVPSIYNYAVEKLVRNRFRNGAEQANKSEKNALVTAWTEGFKGSLITAFEKEIKRMLGDEIGRPTDVPKKPLLRAFRSILTTLGLTSKDKRRWQDAIDRLLRIPKFASPFLDDVEELFRIRKEICRVILDKFPILKTKLTHGKHHIENRASLLVDLVNESIAKSLKASEVENECQLIAKMNSFTVLNRIQAPNPIDLTLINWILQYASGSATVRIQRDLNDLVQEASEKLKGIIKQHPLLVHLNANSTARVFERLSVFWHGFAKKQVPVCNFLDCKQNYAQSKFYLKKPSIHTAKTEAYKQLLELLDDHLIDLDLGSNGTFDDYVAKHCQKPFVGCVSNYNVIMAEKLAASEGSAKLLFVDPDQFKDRADCRIHEENQDEV